MKKLIHSIALLTALFLVTFSPLHASERAAKYPFVMPAPTAIEKMTPLEKISGKKITLHADERRST